MKETLIWFVLLLMVVAGASLLAATCGDSSSQNNEGDEDDDELLGQLGGQVHRLVLLLSHGLHFGFPHLRPVEHLHNHRPAEDADGQLGLGSGLGAGLGGERAQQSSQGDRTNGGRQEGV